MRQLTLTEIWIYPVKSLGGIRLNTSKVLQKGLLFDRRWMLVDEFGGFMTQRIYPQMALFKLSLNGDQITITFKKDPNGIQHPSIILNANTPALGEMIHATIWDDEVDTVEVDQKVSSWFSELLDIKCKLVSFPENNPRPVDQLFKVNGEHVSLADAYPFLIIGQSSFDDLNSRLLHKLPMNHRFRPNFIFTGGEPYEEDDWKNFTIGKNRFQGVKNCARCVLTTVDQETAEKSAEPLATLATYRKRDNKIYFGQNVVAIDHGVVTVGDTIDLRKT
jgi:uncharacterized protein YcbX